MGHFALIKLGQWRSHEVISSTFMNCIVHIVQNSLMEIQFGSLQSHSHIHLYGTQITFHMQMSSDTNTERRPSPNAPVSSLADISA